MALIRADPRPGLAMALVLWLGLLGSGLGAEAPRAAGDHTARLNGLSLWHKVAGTGPVCIVPTPPWGAAGEMYFQFLGPLEQSFTMVYLDSRGTGRSEKPKSTADYRFDQLVADLEALREHLGQRRVWLMGHSEAGMLVLHYAVAHPDRVAGLILLDTAPATNAAWTADVLRRVNERKGQPYYDAGIGPLLAAFDFTETGWRGFNTSVPFQEFWDKSLPFYLYDADFFARHGPELQARATHPGTPAPAEAFSTHALKGMRDSHRHPFDLTPRLQEITAPTLVVAGIGDVICSPTQAQLLHFGIPHSKLLIMEKSGHFPWLEQPDEFFAGVKAFLASIAR